MTSTWVRLTRLDGGSLDLCKFGGNTVKPEKVGTCELPGHTTTQASMEIDRGRLKAAEYKEPPKPQKESNGQDRLQECRHEKSAHASSGFIRDRPIESAYPDQLAAPRVVFGRHDHVGWSILRCSISRRRFSTSAVIMIDET